MVPAYSTVSLTHNLSACNVQIPAVVLFLVWLGADEQRGNAAKRYERGFTRLASLINTQRCRAVRRQCHCPAISAKKKYGTFPSRNVLSPKSRHRQNKLHKISSNGAFVPAIGGFRGPGRKTTLAGRECDSTGGASARATARPCVF